MRRPKVEHVALVIELAGLEIVGTRWAIIITSSVLLPNPEQHITRSIFFLTPPGVPPAEYLVPARWPLADQQGVGGTVRDIGEPHPGIEVKSPVPPVLVDPLNAKIRGESDWERVQS